MIGTLIESIRKDLAALDTEVSATHSPLSHLAAALSELRTAKAELDMVERSLQGAVTVQPAYWRSRELKRWGVDPDEFCEVTWGRKSVELVR